MRRTSFVIILIIVTIVVTACSHTPKGAVTASSQMKPSEFLPNVMVYRNPGAELAQYKKVLVSPAEVYQGPDASFGDMSRREQQRMAEYLVLAMQQKLQQKDLLANQPGPNVASLKLILAGLEKTRTAATVATYVLPVGLAMNLGKGAMGKSGTFMGSATVGGEFTDSVTGTLLASFLAKEAPNALDVTVVGSNWDAAMKGMDKVVDEVVTRLVKMRTGEK